MADETAAKAKVQVDEDEQLALDIIHHIPEDLRLMFSDNVAVQHTASEFTITFSQVRQPLIFKASDYENVENIRADVIARIVLTPPKMLELIQALQENWNIYQRRMKALLRARNVDADKSDSTEGASGEN